MLDVFCRVVSWRFSDVAYWLNCRNLFSVEDVRRWGDFLVTKVGGGMSQEQATTAKMMVRAFVKNDVFLSCQVILFDVYILVHSHVYLTVPNNKQLLMKKYSKN